MNDIEFFIKKLLPNKSAIKPNMQEPIIQKILNVAKNTFARKPSVNHHGYRKRVLDGDAFANQLSEISLLMKQLTVADVGLQHSPALFPDKNPPFQRRFKKEKMDDLEDSVHDQTSYENLEKAPVTYIDVYENCDISVGIFIVAANTGLPLHNHPGMHGILKVVHGTLKISSFDKLPNFDLSDQSKIPNSLQSRFDLIEKGFIIPATESSTLNSSITTLTAPLILGPTTDNFHRIYNSSDQPAAFVDILSPPYNHRGLELAEEGDCQVRECEYFKEINLTATGEQHSVSNSIKWLQMIQTPPDFNCDTEPYQGPQFQL